MELPSLSVSLLIPSLLLLALAAPVFLLAMSARKRAGSSSSKLPPGPWQLPLVGNLYQLLVSSQTHRVLRDLSEKHGPLMYLKLGQVPAIVVSSARVAEQVLRTHGTNFAQRPYILASRIVHHDSTDVVFCPYGGYWRQMRKICTTELLSPKRVRLFRSVREEEVSRLVKKISSTRGSIVNLSEEIFTMTYGITGRAAFGKKSKYQDEFVELVQEFVKVSGGLSVADLFPTAKWLQTISGSRSTFERIKREADRIFLNIVDDHRRDEEVGSGFGGEEKQQEDLVDVLLRIQKQDDLEFPLSQENIIAVMEDMFSAGSETSSATLEWAMSELLINPSTMEKAQAEVRGVFGERGNAEETDLHELKYLQAVIKETLRLHPVAPLLVPRENSEPCEINGYLVPAKTRVFVNAWAIARDPEYWPDPDAFKPERFLDSTVDYRGTDFQYIPFGAGRRICPGILFGLANIELPLAQLLFHFDWKLPEGLKPEELDMTEKFGLTVRRRNDLKLIPVAYRPDAAGE